MLYTACILLMQFNFHCSSLNLFSSGLPFLVSPVCPWLVFWCLKWIWSLTLPGFPGTLNVENDKGYCGFPVSSLLFPLQIYWLLWAQSSMATWDGLCFQHLLGNWGWTEHLISGNCLFSFKYFNHWTKTSFKHTRLNRGKPAYALVTDFGG